MYGAVGIRGVDDYKAPRKWKTLVGPSFDRVTGQICLASDNESFRALLLPQKFGKTLDVPILRSA